MKIKFLIELPYWLHLDNKTSMKCVTDEKKSLEFMILQDLWVLHGVGSDTSKSIIVPEEMVVDRFSLDLKKDVPQLKENGFENAFFYPQKMKSALEIIYTDPDTVKEEDAIDYFQGIKSELLNEINRFLRIYSNIKLNSGDPTMYIVPLHEGYFNTQNTIIYIWEENAEKWILYNKIRYFFSDKMQMNYPVVLLEDNAQEYLKDKFENVKDLNAEEKIIERINYAKQIQDMNSFIIQLSILLESKIEPVLENEERLNPEEIRTFLKEGSLRVFIKYQLPHFLGADYHALIESAQRIVEFRNMIVHKKSNPPWNAELADHCENTWKLILELNRRLEISYRKWTAKEQRVVGISLGHGKPGEFIPIMEFDSLIKAMFVKNYRNIFSSKTIEFIHNFISKDLDKYSEVFAGEYEGYDFARVFRRDTMINIYFFPHLEVIWNKSLLERIFNKIISSKERTEQVQLYVLYRRFPLKRLEELESLIKELIDDFSDKLAIKIIGPVLILDNIAKEVIELLKGVKDSKIEVNVFYEQLKGKNIDIEPYRFELLYQNLVKVEKENDRVFYASRVSDVRFSEDSWKDT